MSYILNSIKISFSDINNYLYNNNNFEEDFYNINEELDALCIEDTTFCWFQQNSSNVYKKELDDFNWLLLANNNNFKLNELFRICKLNHNEYLITGGILECKTTNLCLSFSNGNFEFKNPMITSRRAHSMIKAADFVFVIGGVNNNNESIACCEKYNISKNAWLNISNMKISIFTLIYRKKPH